MKKVFYTFALLIVTLLSCESNSDNETNIPDTSIILPTKVDILYSDGETETISYTYSGMKLIKEESSDGYYTDYVYNNDKLTEINYYDDTNPAVLESYTYDTQGRITTISINIVGSPSITKLNQTYNSDNSIITTSLEGNTNDTPSILTIRNENITVFDEGGFATTTYSYDNKNGAFKNLELREILVTIISENADGLNFTLNNLLSSQTKVNNSTMNSTNCTYNTTYSSFNYPRTIKENNSGDITTYTYNYNND